MSDATTRGLAQLRDVLGDALRTDAADCLAYGYDNSRRQAMPTLRHLAPRKINEDVVVPVSRVPDLVDGLRKISAASGIPM